MEMTINVSKVIEKIFPFEKIHFKYFHNFVLLIDSLMAIVHGFMIICYYIRSF